MAQKDSSSNSRMSPFEGFAIPLAVLFQSILFTLVGTYAMFYYVDVIGFAPAAVGTLILLARIWDGINDPIFGFIADRTRTRWGKFRPYLIFGAIFVSLFVVMMFAVPGLDGTALFVYAGITYVFFSMAYTVVDVPLWASPSVLTTDNLVVTTIVSRVQLFSSIGSVAATIVTMLLVRLLGGGSLQAGFQNTAVVYGLFALAATVAAGATMRERVRASDTEGQLTLKNALQVVFQNRYLIIAMTSSILILITLTLKSIAVPFYATHNLGDMDLVPTIMAVVAVPGIIGFILAPKLVERYGKRNPTLVSLVGAVIFSIIAYFAGYHSLITIMVLQAIVSFFMFIAMVIMTTMFADSVVYADSRFGFRTEGIIFSFRTLSGKIAAALATFLSGIILAAIGYVADSVQTQASLNGLHAIVTVYSGVIMALCIIPLLYYNLTQERIAEMTAARMTRVEGGMEQ